MQHMAATYRHHASVSVAQMAEAGQSVVQAAAQETEEAAQYEPRAETGTEGVRGLTVEPREYETSVTSSAHIRSAGISECPGQIVKESLHFVFYK